MSTILTSIIVCGAIGIVAAIILYLAAKRFAVHDDPLVGQVEELLPGANCGGCGYSGCAAFARACVAATSLDGLYCTGMDAEGMQKIGALLGMQASSHQRKVAVIRCASACDVREVKNLYEGLHSCATAAGLYQGMIDCVYGCLGLGDCVAACPFGAMSIAPGETLPTIDADKCTGCGRCFEACPRALPMILPVSESNRLTWVTCANKERGPVAIKDCNLSCIGCGRCKKACLHEAVTLEEYLATINADKCRNCGECVKTCPRKCINSIEV
ncbi:MAG: RnfABCDGE type electron transport complex subunit B [Muribaculaceae bacterium]|nr:RnfABCDGE type electron transport complex subunit B [Muribaculaceae bacterium]